MNKAVSDYMRQMQRRSAKVRWSGLSAAEKRERMAALAKRRWAKRKPANEFPDAPTTDFGPGDILPSGLPAGKMVELCLKGASGALPMDKATIKAARLFLSQH
jgi:hypothetical protein